MMSETETQTLETIVEPVCRAHGVDLVQAIRVTERGEAVLRVLIDRAGSDDRDGSGVTVADCRAVSRDLGPALDVHDVISGRYRLEVGSPGLDRPLVKLSDFARFSGRTVKVKMHVAQPDGKGGQRRKFQGQLLGLNGANVRLEVDGSELSVPHSEIARANVVYEF